MKIGQIRSTHALSNVNDLLAVNPQKSELWNDPMIVSGQLGHLFSVWRYVHVYIIAVKSFVVLYIVHTLCRQV